MEIFLEKWLAINKGNGTEDGGFIFLALHSRVHVYSLFATCPRCVDSLGGLSAGLEGNRSSIVATIRDRAYCRDHRSWWDWVLLINSSKEIEYGFAMTECSSDIGSGQDIDIAIIFSRCNKVLLHSSGSSVRGGPPDRLHLLWDSSTSS